MGFNRITWLPGRGSADAPGPRSNAVMQLRARREQAAHDRVAARALGGSLISLAAVLGSNVEDPEGRTVGRLEDVVVSWTNSDTYPTVSSIVVRTGHRDVAIGAHWVTIAPPNTVQLQSSAVYARVAERRPADVALAHDVLDRQVVDAEGVQIVRPSDVYLAPMQGRIDLIGIEIGPGALIRRLGPKRLRGHVRPQRVLDWATIRGFSPARTDEVRPRSRRTDLAGSAGAGLVLDASAGDIRRLHPSELKDALEAAQGSDAKGSR
jgi:sporulation protein YlmC with PRC-barrel domain